MTILEVRNNFFEDFRFTFRSKLLAGLKLAPEREAEILEEIVSHLEDRHRELVAEGLSSEEATRFVFEDLDKDEALGRELRSTEERINPDAAVFGAHKSN